MMQTENLLSLSSLPVHYPFSMKAGPFVIKIADQQKELRQVQALREQIFHIENTGAPSKREIWEEEFDRMCDHLIVVDSKTQSVVGTYRLMFSKSSDVFETSREFKIAELLQSPSRKLEIGCACIDRPYRTGPVIALLWRGLAEYMRRTRTDLVFGATSFFQTDLSEIALVYRYFQQKGTLSEKSFSPQDGYEIANFEAQLQKVPAVLSPEVCRKVLMNLPALCRTYLKAGAKIAATPAFYKDLGCFDFLTILNLKETTGSLRRHFHLEEV